jgi:signal transduction histidine kinase
MSDSKAAQDKAPERDRVEGTLARLLDLSRVLATTHDLDKALAQAVNSAVEVVPVAGKCTLQWLDRDGETLRTVAFSDPGDVRTDISPFRPGEGVAGHAFESKQLINVPDVLADERFVPGEPPLRFNSLLVAPLVVKDRALGTLSLSSDEVGAFSATDEALTGLMADQIAAALESAREFSARLQAEEAIQTYAERLKILHEIEQSILAAQLPETIAVACVRRIRQLVPCQRAMVTTVDQEGGIHLLAAEVGSEIELVADISIYQGIFQEQTIGSGWVQGVADLSRLAKRTPFQEALYTEGVHSYAIIPLFIQDELVGTLNLESVHPRAFNTDHIDTGTQVAASLAVAIRQARLYAQAQQEIAERLRAEAQLRRYAAELEAHNAELDAFAHTVAHDLKNPVTAVIAYAQVLEREHDSLQLDMVENFLHVIAQNGRKLATIIDELLLLSSVREKGEIETHPLDMGHIVAEAKRSLLYLIEERGGEIVLPDSWPVATGYGPWVEAVWTNYLSNALKYGGDPPIVELGATVEPNGWFRFWVRDNGKGLTAAERSRLFTPFERLSQMRVQGHGLGLSIVQRIVTRLGGQVGAESEGIPGKGSTFYFTLPSLAPGQQSALPETAEVDTGE